MPLARIDVPAYLLAAGGLAILAYRVWLTLRGDFGFQVWEMAVWSSMKTAASADPIVQGLGIVSLFDFDRACSLQRQRVDAQIGMILVTIGTGCSLASLLARRDAAVLAAVVGAAIGGIAFAWTMTKLYRYSWRHLRKSWWLAHTWLEWLERQIPNPLDQSPSAAQSIVVLAQVSPHPDLETFLNERFGKDNQWLGYHGEETEHWIADFASRWKHRFRSEEWRGWVSSQRIVS